ncbi:hypothetical protein CPAV1605_1125 [seawater metagenome]|uniref:Uncharacterized protein n=1 Tax=seawater metagenome TaxID=1561972 RepID=A0A5E8CKU7_9ZZZZ
MFRYLRQLIKGKNINETQIINNKSIKEDVSYGNFLSKNPKATKKERQAAIKRFLDKTR